MCPGCGAARAHIQRMHRPPKFGVMWDALSIEQLSAAEREAGILPVNIIEAVVSTTLGFGLAALLS